MSRRRKPQGRPVNGMLVLDKPQGMSSNEAVQKAKRLFFARKVGHTGSLDPLATGVLPLCFGDATKFSQYLLASDKTYWVRIRLGVRTDSGDADGKVLATQEVPVLSEAKVEHTLEQFRGDIRQIPSMFSALKHKGQPLYKLARQGIEVEREERSVTVFSNRLLCLSEDELELEIHCSKGTYVRTIAEDLGELLGCGAHVTALRRLSAGPYSEADAVDFKTLEAAREAGVEKLKDYLQPVSSAVGQWPVVVLNETTAFYLRQGQAVMVPQSPVNGWVQLKQAGESTETFLGVGEVLDDGRIAPRRLVVNS